MNTTTATTTTNNNINNNNRNNISINLLTKARTNYYFFLSVPNSPGFETVTKYRNKIAIFALAALLRLLASVELKRITKIFKSLITSIA